jgi:hypothetical protein
MRHLFGLLMGIVLAPAIWVLSGFGIERLTIGLTELRRSELPIGAALLVGAGLLLGLLLGLRTSPLGPIVAGLIYLAAGVLYVLSPARSLNFWVDTLGLRGQGYVAPYAAGLPFLLGAALLVPIISGARWRRRRPRAVGGHPGYNSPGYGPPPGGPYGGPYGASDSHPEPSSPGSQAWPAGAPAPFGPGGYDRTDPAVRNPQAYGDPERTQRLDDR